MCTCRKCASCSCCSRDLGKKPTSWQLHNCNNECRWISRFKSYLKHQPISQIPTPSSDFFAAAARFCRGPTNGQGSLLTCCWIFLIPPKEAAFHWKTGRFSNLSIVLSLLTPVLTRRCPGMRSSLPRASHQAMEHPCPLDRHCKFPEPVARLFKNHQVLFLKENMDLSCPVSSQEKTKIDQKTSQNIDLITQEWHSSLWNKPTTAMKNSFKSSRLGTLAGGLTFRAQNFIMRHATAPMRVIYRNGSHQSHFPNQKLCSNSAWLCYCPGGLERHFPPLFSSWKMEVVSRLFGTSWHKPQVPMLQNTVVWI